ncbi:MAG: universal stress protein [Desulfobacterales bacterium]|jgi:nucleotide-binding universal stress UspA family protein
MLSAILAATDRIDTTDPVVLAGADLARFHGARLRVVFVQETIDTERSGRQDRAPDGAPTIRNQLLDIYKTALRDLPAVEVEIDRGQPWPVITRSAADMGADLIVLGHQSRRSTTEKDLPVVGRIGSTVKGVITREWCPVMVINRPVRLLGEGMRNVIVGIDFSPACECALLFAARMARFADAAVIPVHMVPIPPHPKYSREDFESDRRHAMSHLRRFCTVSLTGVRHAFIVVGGLLPHLALLSKAASLKSDLLVLGSHIRDRRGKWYPGSVVEKTTGTSPCPVVVVNGPAAWSTRPEESERMQGDEDRIDRQIRVFTKRVHPP